MFKKMLIVTHGYAHGGKECALVGAAGWTWADLGEQPNPVTNFNSYASRNFSRFSRLSANFSRKSAKVATRVAIKIWRSLPQVYPKPALIYPWSACRPPAMPQAAHQLLL